MAGRQPEYGYMYGGRGGTGAPTATAPAPVARQQAPISAYTEPDMTPYQQVHDAEVQRMNSGPAPNLAPAPGAMVTGGQSGWIGFDSSGRYAMDPSAYQLGGTSNFVPELQAAVQSTAQQGAAQQQLYANRLGALSAQAATNGYNYASQLQPYAQQSSQLGQQRGEALWQTSAGMMGHAGAVEGRSAPMTNFGNAQNALLDSQALGSRMQNIEAQQGPSGAQAMLQLGTDQAMANQISLARSGRGFGQDATAMGQAQQANAATALNAANQASVLRAQEDAAWRQRQAANMATGAGIQQAAAQQYAGQSQYLTQAQLQQRAMNDQYAAQLLGMGQQGLNAGAQLGLQGTAQAAGITGQAGAQAQQGVTLAGQLEQAGAGMGALGTSQLQQGYQTAAQIAQTQMAAKQAREQNALSYYGVDAGVTAGQAQAQQQMIGAGISAGGAILGATIGSLAGPGGTAAGGMAGGAAANYAYNNWGSSDERRKMDIRPAPAPSFRDVPGAMYRYADPGAPGAGPGQHYGAMAQDIERAVPGVVADTAYGKMVEGPGLSLALAPAVGDVQNRLDRLESLLSGPDMRTAEGPRRGPLANGRTRGAA